ncbi:hypothetical protein Pcinc_039414 [Petrolisthes cinctipes]|uniref:Uncharacterized protein n=1 Tax=Petrolisthes cinctipes TaxID=88211 RepID=A0AAE1ELY3_PETCI|nr:hypothetical protein Pcinc_039414 [Petrolisthes cinctipes]
MNLRPPLLPFRLPSVPLPPRLPPLAPNQHLVNLTSNLDIDFDFVGAPGISDGDDGSGGGGDGSGGGGDGSGGQQLSAAASEPYSTTYCLSFINFTLLK